MFRGRLQARYNDSSCYKNATISRFLEVKNELSTFREPAWNSYRSLPASQHAAYCRRDCVGFLLRCEELKLFFPFEYLLRDNGCMITWSLCTSMQERKKKEYIFLLHTFRKNLNLVKKRNACSEGLENFFIFSHKKLVGGERSGWGKGPLAPPTLRVLQWRNLTIVSSLSKIKHILDN